MPKKSIKEPDWKAVHPWFQQACDIAKANDSFTAVKVKSEEFNQWFSWFRAELGWMPQFMLLAKMRGGDYAVTLPDRWPPKRDEPQRLARK